MMKILIITLIVLDVGIILLFIMFMRRLSRKDNDPNIPESMDDLLQPLITEAKSVSYKLEVLLKDKEQIVNDLADKLDLRISKAIRLVDQTNKNISPSAAETINRTNRLNEPGISNPKPEKSKNFKEFQDDVIRLSQQGLSSDTIAVKLSVTKEEVDLVLSLKKNIEQVKDIAAEMENDKPFQKMTFSKHKSPFVKDIISKKDIKQKKTSLTGHSPRKSAMTFSGGTNTESLNADEVLKLSRRGVQSDAIAQKMGVSKGEVDLVLGLKKKFQNIERNFNNLNAYK